MNKGTEILQRLFLLVLLVIVSGNLLAGAYGFLEKGGEMADDFTMRYRESKYVASGINPFDIVLGIREPTEIGSLWDVAGYTPWGMVYGIIFNFTFLPEQYARYMFCTLYCCLMFAAIYMAYRIIQGGGLSHRAAVLAALTTLAIPGWGSGLSWLNFGALFGAAIFLAVYIMDRHPVGAGMLLGLAATKPQLALPFYLGVLIKKKYKVMIPAILLPSCAWIFSAILTSTGLFEMLLQQRNVMSIIGKQLGNWASGLSIYWESLDFNDSFLSLLSSGSCIFLAGYLWLLMWKNQVNDNMSFFSVPAILSGMWTYSQAHDRTVLMIVIVALAMKRNWKKNEKLLMILFYFSFILDTSRTGRLMSAFLATGNVPSLVLDIMKYLIWIWCLLFLACGKTSTDENAHSLE